MSHQECIVAATHRSGSAKRPPRPAPRLRKRHLSNGPNGWPMPAGLRVQDVFDIDRSEAIVVPKQTSFTEVVRKFAGHNDLRGVFVVDGKQRLAGVITRQDLLHYAAEKLGVPDPDPRAWRDMYRVMTAATAIDACRRGSEGCAVTVDEPLETVLRHMFESELIDIPVVDSDGKIIGDVRLTEVLTKVMSMQEV